MIDPRRLARMRIARRSRHVWLSRSLWNRRLVFLVGSIAVGLAAVGFALAATYAWLLPGAPIAALAVIGMVSYFSGVVQAPITAFVIVTEMTRDSDLALPIMAASLIAHGFSRLVCPHPLYKTLAKSFRPSRPAMLPAAGAASAGSSGTPLA